jgi:hypothetical protein
MVQNDAPLGIINAKKPAQCLKMTTVTGPPAPDSEKKKAADTAALKFWGTRRDERTALVTERRSETGKQFTPGATLI